MLKRFAAFFKSRLALKMTTPSNAPSKDTTPSPRRIIVRREPKSSHFEIHFKVNLPQLELAREFNFNRNVDEKLDVLLSRIKANMEKAFGRKLKKIKNNAGDGVKKPHVTFTAEVFKNKKRVNAELTTCSELFFNGDAEVSRLVFKLCMLPYSVCVNVPYIAKISLPNVVMTEIPVYPLKFVIKFGVIEQSFFRWFVSEGNDKWRFVNDGFCYYPSKVDIGKQLKVECAPSNGRDTGETVTAVTVNPVQASPSPIPYRRRHTYTKESTRYPTFRVISYNILANRYAETEAANNQLFPYCPDHARTWQYRRGMIVDEISGYNADIVCLQEVDSKVFEYDLPAVLKSKFKGVFNKKYTVDEGVATFFNRNRYKLLSNHSCYLGIEVDQNSLFADVWERIKDNASLSERLRGLGTVAQAIVLSDQDDGKKITVIGNTHLFFHPDADHIRLLQGGMYVKFLVQVVETVRAANPGSKVALVACGDFNSVPSCGIFSLFTKGVAPSDLPDWKSKESEEVEGLELRQPLDMDSAYGTPKYTNYTAEFKDCLDYIFYQRDKLKLINVVPPFTDEEFQAHTALPSVVCPSDHIALIANLCWTNP